MNMTKDQKASRFIDMPKAAKVLKVSLRYLPKIMAKAGIDTLEFGHKSKPKFFYIRQQVEALRDQRERTGEAVAISGNE